MTLTEAKKSLARWSRWAAAVTKRWPAGSPLHNLALRRVMEAKIRVMELQQYH